MSQTRSSRPGVGVGVLVRNGDQLLLCRRHGSHGAGTWSPPGGYLEFGERPEACGLRETKEETGLDVVDPRFLAITNDVFPEGKHHITLWFEARYTGGEAVIASSYEMSEIGWFAWDALPTPLFLPFASLLGGDSYPQVQLRVDGHTASPGVWHRR